MPAYEIQLEEGFGAIRRDHWNGLLRPADSPFLEWDWLAALEESGCTAAQAGWVARPLTIRAGGRLIAAAPLYLKGNSAGEFVFDHGWAEASENAGIPYYPKLLVGVPFTPVAGRRLLTHPACTRRPLLAALAAALRDLCNAHEFSSVHVNFCAGDEIEALAEKGFLQRQDIQYHWTNRDYGSFADYLSDLRSKRRNQIRRERNAVRAAGIAITAHEGAAIPDELFATMYRIYLTTIEKKFWGRRYLNRTLFDLLRDRWRRRLCFIVARREGAVIAGTFNVIKDGTLYGRYWGSFEAVRYLHFEVCYYAGIEHCIRRRLWRFEPGAGGDYKFLRGFEPATTNSMHYLRHAGLSSAVGDFLERERSSLRRTVTTMRRATALRRGPSGG